MRQTSMSLEKPSPPGWPAEAAPSTEEDPAVLLSSSWQRVEEDWAADLLAAIGGPDSCQDKETSESPLLPDEKITEILEFKVPVSNDIKPQGCIAVENIWDPNFVKTTGPPPPPSPADSPLVPVYFVDITAATAEQPCPPAPPSTDESFILPQSPPGGVFSPSALTSPSPPPDQSFLISVPEGNSLPTAVFIPASSYMKTPPMSPETRFLEKHSVLRWVIDDQDEGDIPGLSAGISGGPLSQPTATVTSPPALDIKTEVKPSPRPRYICFISFYRPAKIVSS